MIPKKTEFIGIKIDKETKEKLEKQAQKERRTLSQIVLFAIEEYLEKQNPAMG